MKRSCEPNSFPELWPNLWKLYLITVLQWTMGCLQRSSKWQRFQHHRQQKVKTRVYISLRCVYLVIISKRCTTVYNQKTCMWTMYQIEVWNIVAAFQGMYVSPTKHSFVWLQSKCEYRTDRLTDKLMDRQMPEKVIPMCCYASQAHKLMAVAHGVVW